jgi:hypothetical protein
VFQPIFQAGRIRRNLEAAQARFDAALAEYHLGHRTTEDLDLFTQSAPLDEGDNALRETAREPRPLVLAAQEEPQKVLGSGPGDFDAMLCDERL